MNTTRLRQSGAISALLCVFAAMKVMTTAFMPHNPMFGTRAKCHFAKTSCLATSPLPNSEFARDAASKVLPSVASVIPIGVRNITSRGTGFVVDLSIDEKVDNRFVYILTAAHVASPGSRLSVLFDSHSELPASLIGRDVSADLALIRVEIPADSNNNEGHSMTIPPPLQFYQGEDVDSISKNNPPTGTLAFACGYPSGMEGAAFTMGIVCGAARGLEGVAPWMKRQNTNENIANSTDDENTFTDSNEMFQNVTFIVTDASMAPGMSGGPVTNVNGAVMGMCALVRPDLRALGNYAISADVCIRFCNDMKQKMGNKSCNSETRTSEDDLVTSGSKCYRVVLFNDRMNKKERVSKILQDVAKLDEDTANSVMMAAHMTGRGVVKEFYAGDTSSLLHDNNTDDKVNARKQAEDLCERMRMEDILVEVEETLAEIAT